MTSAAVAIFPLLHEPIVQATATETGGLLLVFRSNYCIEILDTSTQYESFWIKYGDTEIIV